ncbi:glycosyltransferase family 2 protein [Bacteroidota bacterium]
MNTKTSSIAIVILNWNGKNFLSKFLPVLVSNSQYPGTEIYVIDNCSTDSSIDLLKNSYNNIKLIELDKNYGFAGGYNRGLKQINAEFYILLNSDVEVTPNWIEPVLKEFRKNDKIAVCQPKIKSYHNKSHFEYAGAAGGFIDKYGFTFCRGRIFGYVEKDEHQYDQFSKIFWASGACFFIKSKVFFEVGGFDEDFFAHMEEIDMCWRIINKGYSVAFTPDSTVYHVGGGTLPNNTPFKNYLNYRNNLYLLYKNLPDTIFIKTIRRRIIFDLLAIIRFLLLFQFRNAFSVFKAYKDFNSSRFKFYRKRVKNRTSYDLNYGAANLVNLSIVLEYFLKRRKNFSTLRLESFSNDINREKTNQS